jgi:FkbM family methyltransferase
MTADQLRQIMIAYQGTRYSELGQDIMVHCLLDQPKTGFFVEFGAMDGEIASNSLLFERHHDWSGIVAEPNRRFHTSLSSNRRCHIDHRAVHSHSGGTQEFKEVDHHMGLSALTEFMLNDHHANTRQSSPGNTYNVKLISLCDMLDHYHAPRTIDYISMDTEGSELDILRTFDFDRYTVKIWTIEHNFFGASRDGIYDIMVANGYKRILTDMSKYDDWYVKENLLEN